MDVSDWIDRLDDLVREAKTLPLTNQVRVARQELFDLLDQIRAIVPGEVTQARRIVKERRQIDEEVMREADRVRAEARERAAEGASQTVVTRLAERQADRILADGRQQARRSRAATDEWADEILATLQLNLEEFLQAVQRGREYMRDRFAG